MTGETAALVWIGADGGTAGRWSGPGEAAIPADDRGLLLGDGLLETILIEEARPLLLGEHLVRWREGAAVLGLPPPPGEELVAPLAAEACRRSGIRTGALRLNWSRGSGGRGLEPVPEGKGRFWLQLSPWLPRFSPVAVIVSATERRCATSLLSRCKTFAYGSAIQARRQARAAGAEDALLESTAGGLCCGTAANLIVRLGRRWWTPPLSSGCLPGVMRGRGLELERFTEAREPLAAESLRSGGIQEACLINSLGCRPVSSCEGMPLAPLSPAAAEELWRSLLPPG